jgi:hypothetical protein
MPTFLALYAADSAIGGSLVGLPVQRHPDRETARRVVSNDLNAAMVSHPGQCLTASRHSFRRLLPRPRAYLDGDLVVGHAGRPPP